MRQITTGKLRKCQMCLFQIKFCQTLIPIPYVYSYLAQEVSLYKIYPTLLFHNVFIITAVRRQALNQCKLLVIKCNSKNMFHCSELSSRTSAGALCNIINSLCGTCKKDLLVKVILQKRCASLQVLRQL